MKRAFLVLIAVLLGVNRLLAQEIKKQENRQETKMDAFESKTGMLVKFVDYKLPLLPGSYLTAAETRIRKITSESLTAYFYQISRKGEYSTSTASIAYQDLKEVIKALASLKSTEQQDIAANPDYLENKFTTDDGFQLGYYISKGKSSWYIRLEKYGSNNTIFIKDYASLEATFNEALKKIEELMN